mmetsp:Transcript_94339/g.219208  ORF Transcript_94339/g.219208 Transcript_94339/m.219208 type:complete len:165 (+) Transcript_94339:58-552(+)|eukprot:CAMPEP_0171092848 /NCGR_PEP_ID=MMETSP0766_2-20121228/37709_1 /TAXON_ID=439317 /ORGANISM="Gambierdiscus australes, Strain CAWD 149" /LENGTH=164 /DNA_ID=CAMNT_0011551167 /DNA_START=63 /DNA_END=557 /DNA_ORIENTATION=+
MANPRSPTAAKKGQKDLTDVQKSEIRQAFDLFDMDGSGTIDVRQLETAMKALGCEPTQEELAICNRPMDQEDGTGGITYDEFLGMMRQKMLEFEPRDNMIKAFGLIDKKKTGKINFETLRNVMRDVGDKATDEEIQEIIDMIGEGTGEISMEDFLKVMKKQKLC